MASPSARGPAEARGQLGAQTIALRVVAGILAVGALYFLASILVPFFLALVFAIALTPLAARLERLGLGRTLASLACVLSVAAVLLGVAVLVAYQAGSILGNADDYLSGFARHADALSKAVGGDRLMETLGVLEDADGGKSVDRAYWANLLRQNARSIGRWVATGLGGALGLLGGAIILLAFLFYMLDGRSEWVRRIGRAATALGMHPRERERSRIREEIGTYVKYLAIVSTAYMVVMSLALWAIGVPQPILWGVLTGLLEVVPYFGPLIAGAMPTIMALGTGKGLWQPAAVVALFAVLQTVEGYVVSPKLYGGAVKIDPVTVLFGVLFFGWLWGPAGLAAAMPMMILLRGLLDITPDTPALDALADAGEGEA